MKEISLDKIRAFVPVDLLGKRQYSENEVNNMMKEAIRQALELAAEEAEIDRYKAFGQWFTRIDKESITNIINRVK